MNMVLVREPALAFGATEKFWIVFPTCEPAVIHESDRGAKVHVQEGWLMAIPQSGLSLRQPRISRVTRMRVADIPNYAKGGWHPYRLLE